MSDPAQFFPPLIMRNFALTITGIAAALYLFPVAHLGFLKEYAEVKPSGSFVHRFTVNEDAGETGGHSRALRIQRRFVNILKVQG
ncbi:hypothetical protein [Blastopirellula marina]|uniref:Uncharacterized protein n=1 Tax=Blastopirellula marina TaxID=124 RepID=A0A2S8GSJ9_9BACT|nr:hypothetical protein [Blastopirellula marina]PQO47406.1 hypothetical protein C5Y93_05010 [Blastopirellula marina]